MMLPQGVVSPRSNEVRGEGLRVIGSDRSLLLFLAASLFGAFVYFQGEATLPLHVKAAGLSEAVYGVLISINGLVSSCLSCSSLRGRNRVIRER